MYALGRRGDVAAVLAAALVAAIPASRTAQAQLSLNTDVASLARLPVVDSSSLRAAAGSLAGRSGKLLARFIAPPRSISIPVLSQNLGYAAAVIPPIQVIAGPGSVGQFSLITMRGFAEKVGSYVGGYHVGYWPEERGGLRSEAYGNPEGFIEVTRENQHLRVSEHFTLRDFLTHDQNDVWPKYLVLREDLLDKLELVIQDLEERGIRAGGMKVISGFRTPQYNLALGAASGRAIDSRHQFGDAADVYMDYNGDGRMDDLNRDGRVNFADVKIILDAVERVERRHPELVGGTGLYHSMGPRGPFAHIDVRGDRARWVNKARTAKKKSPRKPSRSAAKSRAPGNRKS